MSSLFARYRSGSGVDAVAGAEALVSRLLARRTGLPAAHAPAFAPTDDSIQELLEVSPKACAEELGHTFLPCVLAYLRRAPRLLPLTPTPAPDSVLQARHVDAVVAPYNALGGPAVLSFLARGVLVIAVQENETSMKVDRDGLLGQQGVLGGGRVALARSYAEAAGLLAAHRAGISFESLTAKVEPVRVIEL
mmetsp:Transcript_4210/g.5789  ORF Transcript_4210/g.5789 Transcript_4210/m.5789 type:complete len:192 (-) Transcript_4210:34-609(-)